MGNCNRCNEPATKHCSRCKIKYYCSAWCQKEDYVYHIIDCPPEKGLRTIDYLVRDVFNGFMPDEVAVQYEYGFMNCIKYEERTMLLGLYIGLIKHMGCGASKIHLWWKNGELPLNIKKTYDEAGTDSEYYKYYRWFLENEHVLQGLHQYKCDGKTLRDKYLGLVRPYQSEHDKTIPVNSLSSSKFDVVTFYATIIMGWIPKIEQQSWIDFGFCTCKFSEECKEEVRLGDLYRELIVQKGCKIDEFDDAYVSGSIIDLLSKKCDGSWLPESGIEVPKFNGAVKSVYYLKQYTLSESVDIIPSVMEDYGFCNCHTENEIKQLKSMYKKLIKTPQFDPRDLHKACSKGEIFDYVSSILPNEEVKKDLLKNSYPLKDLS